jgi:phosphatidylinositol kinase/protein kinase (PI-3  family)
VIPLSPDSGLFEWLDEIDTMYELILDYRNRPGKPALDHEAKMLKEVGIRLLNLNFGQI